VALRLRLRDLAAARPRFGYRRLHIMLRREGWAVNHKRIYRLYREEQLLVRTKRRRKLVSRVRGRLPQPSAPRQQWAMDFVSDALVGAHHLRVFTVIDVYTRECLALVAGATMPAAAVTAALDRAIARYGAPLAIMCDNGTEFTSTHFDLWARTRQIAIEYITPGRPVENSWIESFNGRLRDECLNAHWFTSIDHARTVLHTWRHDYNELRPHSGIGDRTPTEYATALVAAAAAAR
jgi:putative transposase